MSSMIILASGSPRRRELLSALFSEFEIMKADKDEIVTKTQPDEIVKELSYKKAEEVWNKAVDEGKLDGEDILLIAADTLVFKDNRRMGKPKDFDDAFNMLDSLSGTSHFVYTGVTLFWGNKGNVIKHSFYEATEVSFYDVSDEDIIAYINTKEPMDKAGAYAIQGGFAKHVKEIKGEYANVVGLPVARLYQELKAIGFNGFT